MEKMCDAKQIAFTSSRTAFGELSYQQAVWVSG